MSTILLRIASVVFALYTVGHTYGALYKDPSTGDSAKQVVLYSLRRYHENLAGASRSYWDFYMGFGWLVSCALVLFAVLSWQLSTLARTQPSIARPLILTLFVVSIPMTVLAYTNFFAAPAILSTAATLLLGAAAFTLP